MAVSEEDTERRMEREEGMKRGERRIVTNLTRTHPHSHAERVLTAQACDPEGAVHQRGQAQQHRLLSMSKTPHTCTKPLHIPSGAHGCIVTLSFLLSFSLSYAHTHTRFVVSAESWN